LIDLDSACFLLYDIASYLKGVLKAYLMYDTFIIGQISKDINIYHNGKVIHENGGAVLYSGYIAGAMDHKTAVLPKGNINIINPNEAFKNAKNVDVYPVNCKSHTSIKNVYHTPDREQRTSTALNKIETYTINEIPDIDAKIYYISGLMKGDIDDSLIDCLYGKKIIAFDVQGALRCAEDNGLMIFHDWPEKLKYLPKIDYLKTDARESKTMTFTDDRELSAKMMYDWGAKEIMITHFTEVIIYDGKKIYRQPLKPRTLDGRSGRGDTCFSVYVAERLYHSIEDSLLMAAAAVSLKMETPGPFNYGRDTVIEYINHFYK
jgi:sugar/nucleoside kinase (ribokinase family)